MDARDRGPAAQGPGAVAAIPPRDADIDRVVLSPRSIAAIAGSFLLMGLVVSGYGPLLEHLTRRFDVSLPVAGATISVQYAGALAGVFVAMVTIERRAARFTVIGSCAAAGLGLVIAGVATSWIFFLGGVLIFGVGFGGLDIALNQVVAYSEGSRRAALLNALNSAYPAGAVIGPILVAAFAADHFSALFLAAAGAWVVLMVGVLGIRGSVPVGVGAPRRPSPLVG